MSPRYRLLPALVAAAALVAGASAPATAAESSSSTVLRLTFDHGETLAPRTLVVDDSGAEHHGVVAAKAGSGIRAGTRYWGSTTAEFPRSCPERGCPRAVVEVSDDDDLDPGFAPITFGVRAKLLPEQATDGQNMLQKGLWGEPGGQWKLQVDGRGGFPSCVVSGVDQDGAFRRVTVGSSVSITDGDWHRVVCRRTATSVDVLVDYEVAGSTRMRPVELSSAADVLVGGKGLWNSDNDQFGGALDDVFVDVG